LADLKGKSSAINTLPASPAFSSTSPDLQVVSAPFGNAARSASGVSMGKSAPASALTIWHVFLL
jgi:hypothetical protein